MDESLIEVRKGKSQWWGFGANNWGGGDIEELSAFVSKPYPDIYILFNLLKKKYFD